MLFGVQIVRLDKNLPLPVYSQPGDAGMDLYAVKDYYLPPGERYLMATGIALAIPHGYAGFVHPRSGLAAKHGISVVNAPGTVDSGYRGEIKVNLINLDLARGFQIDRGDRIAQIVFQPVVQVSLEEVERLPDSVRGDGGHGSTGIKVHFAEGGIV